MATERIQLRIEDSYSGIGLKQADRAVATFGRTCKAQLDILRQTTGDLSGQFGEFGTIIQGIAKGGVLGIILAGVSAVVTKTVEGFREAREAVRKAREETKLYATETRRAFEERIKARLDRQIAAENAEIEKQVKLAKEAAAAFASWAGANAAANAAKTGAEVSGRNVETEQLRTKLEQETADMEAGPERQRKELENALKLAIEEGETSILEASRATSAAGLAVIQQRQKMQKYTDALDSERLAALEAQHKEAINREKIVREKVAQREIAAGKALDDFIEAQEKETAAAKRLAEREAKRSEIEKKIAANAEKAQAIRAGIDNRIAGAKSKAAEWEESAKGGRGMIFKDWQKQQREKARQERDERTRWHQDSVDQNREKRIQEYARRHGWSRVSRADRDWMRQREEWKKMQDPKNNPGIKELAKLEEEKKKLQADTLTEMKALKDELKKLGTQ